VTHPALALLIGPEFDEFLCAPIGDDRNGTGLSVLSALARLYQQRLTRRVSLAVGTKILGIRTKTFAGFVGNPTG
jgi:hypothetical protein